MGQETNTELLQTLLNMENMPNDGEAYRFKGFCKGIIGDMKGGCEDWRKAVSLGDSDSAVQLEENCN